MIQIQAGTCEMARRYGVAVHAYCLMTNHVHFLATPSCKESISNAMKVIGSRYAQYMKPALPADGHAVGRAAPVQSCAVGTVFIVLLPVH